MSDRANNLANPNAELALLGSVFRANPEQRTLWASTVKEEWFTTADHVMACRVITDLVGKGLPIAPSLVEDGLRTQGMAEAGLRLVEELGRAIPTAGLWQPLSQRVEKYYLRRRGVAAAEAAKKLFTDLSVDPMEALETVESEFFSLHKVNLGNGMRHISKALAEAIKSIEESIDNRGHVTGGLPTGFTDLDRMNIKGMRPGQVYFYGAPPGGGKTVFLMKQMWNIAMGRGDYAEYEKYHTAEPVGVFSLEMSDVQLAERILIRLAEIELHSLDRGMINHHEKRRIAEAVTQMQKSMLHIEHCPGMTVQEFRVKARYAVTAMKLKAIGVDYVQLMNSSSKEARGNRTQAMMDVSLGIKLTAQECGVPIIALAQPKQETWGKRAGLDAFAETSQLAKDADLVGMLGNWDKLNLGEEQGEERVPQNPDDPQICAYLDIVKNRNGPNTEGKPPIKLKWAKDFFDFMSTTGRLFSGDEGQHQQR